MIRLVQGNINTIILNNLYMQKKEENKTKKRAKQRTGAKKTAKNPAVKNAKKKTKTAVSKSARKKNSVKNKPMKKAEKIDSGKTKNNKSKDAYLAEWTAPEFIKTNEEVLFYYASIVGSVLMIIWSFWQGSFITVATFAMVIIVIIFQMHRQPLDVECKIDLDGITMNLKLYRYNEIDSFEVIQGDENNILKFKLKNAFLPVKEIYLMDQDPYYIRAALEHFLPEKKQKEALLSYEKKREFGEDMSEEEFYEYLKEEEEKDQ